MTSLVERIYTLIKAGYSGIWVEAPDAVEIGIKLRQAREQFESPVEFLFWDAVDGWKSSIEPSRNPPSKPPILQFHEQPPRTKVVHVLVHFHRFLNAPDIVCRLLHYMRIGEQIGSSYIIIVPSGVKPPAELEHRLHMMQDALPTIEVLKDRARSIAVSSGLEEITDDSCLAAAQAAVGLTMYEAESAFALSLVEHKALVPKKILEVKSDLIKSSGFMDIYYDGPDFSSIGGLDHVKQFTKKCLTKNDAIARPRGVLLLGVPGAGKSALCRAVGVETGRPVLSVNIGSLYGSLVGQTEQNVRRMLNLVDSIAPCILFLDEVEKALSGLQSSGKTDSGVSARVFGTLLTWLNDHETDVYTMVTCNDISKLPPEFSRAERFDVLFFFDLPTEKERARIWEIYLKQYQLELLPDFSKCVTRSDSWTGAEIKTCCRLARMLGIDVLKAMDLIIPVAETMQDSLNNLRGWATGRCLDASFPVVYDSRKRETDDLLNRRVDLVS